MGASTDSVPEQANISGQYITLRVNNGSVGQTTGILTINMSQGFDGLTEDEMRALSIASAEDVLGFDHVFYRYTGAGASGVDLANEDFSSSDWEEVIPDFLTSNAPIWPVTVTTGQTVLVQSDDPTGYGLYEYVGADTAMHLHRQDFTNTNFWQLVTTSVNTGSGAVNLTQGQLVQDLSTVGYVTLQVWDDVDLAATDANADYGLSVQATDGVALQHQQDIRLGDVIAGGDVRLQATEAIVDRNTAPTAAVQTFGSLLLRAGTTIDNISDGQAVRIQMLETERLSVDGGDVIDLVQVNAGYTINGSVRDV